MFNQSKVISHLSAVPLHVVIGVLVSVNEHKAMVVEDHAGPDKQVLGVVVL